MIKNPNPSGAWSALLRLRSRLNRIENWEELAQESNYSVVNLARICCVSVRQLERFFSATRSHSPHKWLHTLRMGKALQLLNAGFIVKEVAGQLGYKQVSHFSRDFTKHFGYPPRDYLYGAIQMSRLGTGCRV